MKCTKPRVDISKEILVNLHKIQERSREYEEIKVYSIWDILELTKCNLTKEGNKNTRESISNISNFNIVDL
jgi:hypothetical protein